MTMEMKKSRGSMNHQGVKTGFTDTHGGHRFVCKTCRKRFNSFQALGGHQGIHRRAKLISEDNDALCLLSLDTSASNSSRLHRCKTCMKEFMTGQALGGHMSQHRLEKALILMKRERLRLQEMVEENIVESDLTVAAAGLRRLKAEEDEQRKERSELVLAAKEWRLYL